MLVFFFDAAPAAAAALAALVSRPWEHIGQGQFSSPLSRSRLSALGSHGTGDFSRGTGRGNEVGISVTAFHHHHRLRYAAGILLGNADRTSACVNTFFDLIFSLIANRCR